MSGRAPPRAILFDLGGVLLPFDRELRIEAIVRRTGATAEAAREFMALDVHRGLDRGDASEFDLAAEFVAFFGVRVSPLMTNSNRPCGGRVRPTIMLSTTTIPK